MRTETDFGDTYRILINIIQTFAKLQFEIKHFFGKASQKKL